MKARIKDSNIIGTVIDSDPKNKMVKFLPDGEINPLVIAKDTIEIIGFLKPLVEFLIKLFKKKDLPTQFIFEGNLYKYYSYMNDSGMFVAGYSFEPMNQDKRFKVWARRKIRVKNLLRKTLKEYKIKF